MSSILGKIAVKSEELNSSRFGVYWKSVMIMWRNSKGRASLVLVYIFLGCLCRLDASASPSQDGKSHPVSASRLDSGSEYSLRQNFPMCDDFLKVQWIDKEKRIGYTKFKGVRNGKPYGNWWTLVHLDKWYPVFDYDLSRFVQRGVLNVAAIKKLVSEGSIEIPDRSLVIHAKTDVAFKTIGDVRGVHDATIANHSKNVCVPYPDNGRVWIAEYKWVGAVYGEKEIRAKQEKLAQFFPADGFPEFRAAFPVDFNFDGREDYFMGDPIVYTIGEKYYSATQLWKNNISDLNFGKYIFPPKDEICQVLSPGASYLTTDGRNYYWNNECNLTERTRVERVEP